MSFIESFSFLISNGTCVFVSIFIYFGLTLKLHMSHRIERCFVLLRSILFENIINSNIHGCFKSRCLMRMSIIIPCAPISIFFIALLELADYADQILPFVVKVSLCAESQVLNGKSVVHAGRCSLISDGSGILLFLVAHH